MKKRLTFSTGDWIAVGYVVAHIVLLVLFWTPFLAVTKAHPYVMGFIKFADLATFGSNLKVRIGDGRWHIRPPVKLILQLLIWGVWGMWITWAFPFFAGLGDKVISFAPWLAPAGSVGFVTTALIRSLTINLLFAWIMMLSHDLCEKTVFQAVLGEPWFPELYFKPQAFWGTWGIKGKVSQWIYKFWIWAHWITYMLPSELRILFAALLSVMLGIFTTVGGKKK